MRDEFVERVVLALIAVLLVIGVAALDSASAEVDPCAYERMYGVAPFPPGTCEAAELARYSAEQRERRRLEAEERQRQIIAELDSRPRIEVRSVAIRECGRGFYDCILITLRNNGEQMVTDVQGRIYPRDGWGEPVTRCGYYGSEWRWWDVFGVGGGNEFRIEVDTPCLRGLGDATSFTLDRVLFEDGSTWPY